MATSSVTELVQAVKRPRSLSESTNRPFTRKSGGDGGGSGLEQDTRKELAGQARRNSENNVAPPPRRNSHGGGSGSGYSRRSMQRINEVPEKKQRKSLRLSFMG